MLTMASAWISDSSKRFCSSAMAECASAAPRI
jgi:hypothetical protein